MDKDKNYHIIRKEILPNEKICSYFDEICSKSNNLYNVTNYYIRQLYIGTKKRNNNQQLTPNEQDVFDIVTNALPLLDEISVNNIRTKISKLEKTLLLNREDKKVLEELEQYKEKLLKLKPHSLPKSGFPSYSLLDGVFKVTNNVDYRVLPVQVAQQTMRQCFTDWKNFFESVKKYKANPSGFTGKPKIPGYKKSGSKFNVMFTNQTSGFHFNNE